MFRRDPIRSTIRSPDPIRSPEMFFRRDVAQHGAAVPADHGRADRAGNVIVAGRDVGRERAEGVERRFVAPLELFLHVLFDQVLFRF